MHSATRAALLPLRLALDFALPPRCAGCGEIVAADHLFCAACWTTLDFLAGPACVSCGFPFDYDIGADARCGACLADPPAIADMRAAVAYGDIARRLALKLKHGRIGVAETLARQMLRLIDRSEDRDALLIPVPLHRWRLWRRGYNQAQLIARALSRDTGIPLVADLLHRRKATPILGGMGPQQRRRAVSNAFVVSDRTRHRIEDRTILLIDDVYTTGATVNACAKALLRSGAAQVKAVCWARVVRDIDNPPF